MSKPAPGTMLGNGINYLFERGVQHIARASLRADFTRLYGSGEVKGG